MFLMTILTVALAGQTTSILDSASGAFLDETARPEALFQGADSAYAAGDFPTAALLYLEALRNGPRDAGAVYNLACCYGLMGEPELAAVTLRRAWSAGFEDVDHMQWDPDFDPVREEPVFASLLDSLTAVAGVRELALGRDLVFTAEGPFHCRVRTPEGWDGVTPLPLVIGIHGLGDSPDAFIGLWEVVGQYDCIFAVPQAPTAIYLGDRIGYDWFDGDWDDGSWLRSAALSRGCLFSILDVLEAEYPVTEVYLFGFSQGGAMTYMAGLHAPERFAALAPFSGWLERAIVTDEELAAAASIPVRIVHGDEDTMVGPQEAYTADSLLTSLGYDVSLTMFSGGHRFPREALTAFLDEFLGGE